MRRSCSKVAGLSDEEAKRVPTASSLSLFAIVKHLAFVERRWFQNAVAGNDDPGPVAPADPAEELEVREGDTIDSVRALYEQRIAESQAITAAVSSPDAPTHPATTG